jgi:hypothetical protein
MSLGLDPMHGLPPDELEPASLLEMPLRVWAEIGRTRMPAASVVGMAEGTIIDLDCEPDEPAELFVNGRHFGTGRVILVDGEWALRVETLDDDGYLIDDAVDDAIHDGEEPIEQPSSDGQPAPEASE